MVCPDFPEVTVKATDLRPPLPPPPFKYEVTVTEQAGVDLTDYQVLLKVENDPDFFAAFNNDHKYMEVYDEDKSTLLNFWVEEWDTVNKNARIWIKVPSIPANGTRKLYLRYNSARTEPLSDPEATMELYDDFEDGVIDTAKWDAIAACSEANGVLTISKPGVSHFDKQLLSVGSWENLRVRARIRCTDNSSGGNIWINLRRIDADNAYNFGDNGVGVSGAEIRILKKVAGSVTVLASLGVTNAVNEWYILDCCIYGSKLKFTQTWPDGTEQSISAEDTDITGAHPINLATYNNDVIEIDWAYVTKYVDPEPSVSYSKL